MSPDELIKSCRYIKEKCTCGCGKSYKKWINTPNPPDFEIIEYTNITNEPLSVKRLSDNSVFRLGDTITRTSAAGKKYRRSIVFQINVYGKDNNKIQIESYTINSRGIASICNDKMDYNSADNPNLFALIKKV